MKPNIFNHRMNIGQDGRFFNLEDTVRPSLQRAAAIADLIEVACEVADICSFENETLWRAAQVIRYEIRDTEALIEAYLEEKRTEAQTEKEVDKASQEILLQFAAASDAEAEEICTDFLRRRGMQAQKKKPD
jgi:hypothetical protein